MLLEGWQGRLMFYAPGGLAGYLGDTTSLLDDGFAMATTDTGHEGAEPDFLKNDKARIDYSSSSTNGRNWDQTRCRKASKNWRCMGDSTKRCDERRQPPQGTG